MPRQQSYATHRRYLPLYHFFVQPILALNFVYRLDKYVDGPSFDTGWAVVVSLAMLGVAVSARWMAIIVQSRVIRLEERLRLTRLMPASEHAGIERLPTRQLIGLRFASDEEVVGLARRAIAGELRTTKEIKQSVQAWRPDFLRV